MLRRPHAIEMALDLARMPGLARSSVGVALPPHIIEIMRVAAGSPNACQEAVAATGEPARVLVDAARFYLQQVLFRPDADCYRVLGLAPGASRTIARSHMRLLLQWLHPDRNSNLDAVYAERVIKAWREVSALSGETQPQSSETAARQAGGFIFRPPWIQYPMKNRPRRSWRAFAWLLPSGFVLVFVILFVAYYLAPEQAAAIIRMR